MDPRFIHFVEMVARCLTRRRRWYGRRNSGRLAAGCGECSRPLEQPCARTKYIYRSKICMSARDVNVTCCWAVWSRLEALKPVSVVSSSTCQSIWSVWEMLESSLSLSAGDVWLVLELSWGLSGAAGICGAPERVLRVSTTLFIPASSKFSCRSLIALFFCIFFISLPQLSLWLSPELLDRPRSLSLSAPTEQKPSPPKKAYARTPARPHATHRQPDQRRKKHRPSNRSIHTFTHTHAHF
jgi:hypothetical protein